MLRKLHVRRLGRVEYEDGLRAQKMLVEERAAGRVPDTLLLLEHPRVITLGRGAHRENILRPQGFEIYETDRGGDVTYHGPGQVVGYPILDLKPDRKDVRKYVASLEEIMIRVAAGYGIRSERVQGRVGIWVPVPPPSAPALRGHSPLLPAAKLGAIGVHISRWITSHGFAFNVRTDLSDFGAIVPCGIAGASVASLESLCGAAPPMAEVEQRFAATAAAVWESEASEVPDELHTVSVVMQREDGRVLLLHRTPENGGFWQILTGTTEPGESPLQTAAREIHEETGFSPRLDELRDLGYVHSFAIGTRFAQETAFAVRVEGEPTLSDEHDAHRWCTVDEALALLPFPGLRRAVTLIGRPPRTPG